jgi:hypothetical protein
VRKNDVQNVPKLHQELSQLSEMIQESEVSFLYCPHPKSLATFVEKLKEAKVSYSMLSESNLSSS